MMPLLAVGTATIENSLLLHQTINTASHHLQRRVSSVSSGDRSTAALLLPAALTNSQGDTMRALHHCYRTHRADKTPADSGRSPSVVRRSRGPRGLSTDRRAGGWATDTSPLPPPPRPLPRTPAHVTRDLIRPKHEPQTPAQPDAPDIGSTKSDRNRSTNKRRRSSQPPARV